MESDEDLDMDMDVITKSFTKGLLALLPVIITAWVLWWLGTTIEAALGGLVQRAAPALYFRGAGIVIGIALVFIVGLLMHLFVVRRVVDLIEVPLRQIPLIKTVYGSVKDLMGMFETPTDADAGKVVVITINNCDLVGFITRDHFEDLPEGVGGDDMVAVYLPMSYQLGGFTILVKRDQLRPINMGIEEAMTFVITAGVKKDRENDKA